LKNTPPVLADARSKLTIATLSNIINQASADVNAWIKMRNRYAKLVLMIDFGTLINVNADAKMKSTVRLA